MSDKGSSSESRAKWAGEAYDFLRLFHDVSRRLTGLLLLQIGWALFVYWMQRALAGTSDAGAAAAGEPTLAGIRVSVIYVTGAVVWLATWLVSSGLWWAARRVAFAAVVRPLVRWRPTFLIHAALLAAVPLDLIVSAVWWAITRLTRRPFYVVSEQALELLSNTPDEVTNKLRGLKGRGYVTRKALLNAVSETLTADELALVRGNIVLSVVFARFAIGNRAATSAGALVNRVLSAMHITFSPLIANSWDEQFLAAAAPAQLFAWPVGQLRAKAIGSKAVRFLGFSVLPPLLTVENAGQASRRRRSLGVDAILWGSYERGENGRLWLHVEQDFQWLPETQQRVSKRGAGATQRIDPFPHALEIRFGSVNVASDDQLQLYVLLILTILRSIEIRSERSWKMGGTSRFLDSAALDYGLRDYLIDYLVYKAFLPTADQEPATPGHIEPVDAVLTRTVSQWIGREIAHQREPVTQSRMKHLADLAAKCAALAPDDLETVYRLAACQVLTGDGAVLSTLYRACDLETPAADTRDVSILDAHAQLMFRDLTGLDLVKSGSRGAVRIPEEWPLVAQAHARDRDHALPSRLSLAERKWAVFVILVCRVIAQRDNETASTWAAVVDAVLPYSAAFKYESRALAAPALVIVRRLIEHVHPELLASVAGV
jgi:hypothetical protein